MTREISREEILAMPAGRELDALVAKVSMNLCVLDDVQGYGDGCVMSDKGFDEWEKHPMYGKVDDPEILSPYSTDMGAAFPVAVKLGEKFHFSLCHDVRHEGYCASFETRDGSAIYSCDADEMPEAICKAALLATMEETP